MMLYCEGCVVRGASFGVNSFRTRRGPQTAATLLLNLRHRILKRFVSKGVGFGYVTAGGTGLRAFAGMLQGVRVAQSWRATVVARDRHARNYSVPARSCDVMLEEVVGLGAERERRCSHTCQGESPAVISFRSVDEELRLVFFNK